MAKLATGYKKRHLYPIEGFKNDMFNQLHNITSASTPTATIITNSNPLTPAHVEFLQCSILASQYNIAKRFVQENPIHSFASEVSSSSEDFLRYHYLLGMVHLGCDDYSNAISAFQICLTIPSKIVSAISIEAMKKMMLVKCLILYQEDEHEQSQSIKSNSIYQQQRKKDRSGTSRGVSNTNSHEGEYTGNLALVKQICDMPNSVSTSVFKFFTSSATSNDFLLQESMQIYESLVRAFVALDLKAFQKCLKEGKDKLEADGNMGLAKQLVTLMQYRSVRNISSIYEAIPLSKLAKKLGFEDGIVGISKAESLLLQIALRQKCSDSTSVLLSHIDFTIDSASSVVYFYEIGFESGGDTDLADREKMQTELTKRLMASMNLAERITNMEIDVTCSSKYQAIVSRENSDKGGKMPSGDLPRSVVSEI